MVKLKIGAVNKSLNSHNYRATNSTTCDFSFVQPTLCRLTYPHGRVKGSMRSFVRLSPLPFPTFGDLRLKSEAFWVPIDDVFPNFGLLMSEKRCYDTRAGMTKVVKSLPFTNNAQLQYALNRFSSSDIYTMAVNASIHASPLGLDADKATNLNDVKAIDYNMYKDMVYNVGKETGVYTFSGNPAYSATLVSLMKAVDNGELTDDKAISLYAASSTQQNFLKKKDSYDYIVVVNSGDASSVTSASATGYVYNPQARAMRKIFLGLGYNPSIDDGTTVSILPLLAYYKAYYDRFVPFREKPWTETWAYRLITDIQTSPSSYESLLNFKDDYIVGTAPSDNADYPSFFFTKFLYYELSNCFSTQDVNFISLHTQNVTDGAYDLQADRTVPTTSPSSKVSLTNGYNNTRILPDGSVETISGGLVPQGSTGLNAVSLALIQKMYGYLNRDSILGNRIDTWLKSHLNSETYNEYFRRIHAVSESDIRITIGDIDSTSNTYDENSEGATTGAVLGAYGGKGVGSGELKFNLGGSTYGYAIILTYVMPMTSYFQGTDAQLFALNKWQIPQKEFDALGYEVSPASILWTDDGISLRGDNKVANTVDRKILTNSDGFGYVPRYSGFKYAKNTVNGDFSRRSTKTGMDCFYLDREIAHREIPDTVDVNSNSIVVQSSTIPTAGDVWRYVQKYDFLTNYNRIFYNSGNYGITNLTSTAAQQPLSATDDNLFCHIVFDWTENTPLRPLSVSFETDVNKSDEKITVSPS